MLEDHREKLFLLGIFFFALFLRLAHVLSMRDCVLFCNPIMDMAEHHRWAQTLAQGNWIGKGAFFRAPLYPYFLGLIYYLFGESFLLPRLFQCILGSLSCLWIYFLAKNAFGRSVAILSGVLSSIYWPFVFFDGELLLTSLALNLNMLSLLVLQRALESDSFGTWFFSGLCLGFAAITRPNILLFQLTLLLMLLVGVSFKRQSFGTILALLLGSTLVIAPVSLRNYFVSGDFVAIAWQGGVNFYIGNNPRSDGHTAIVPGTRSDWEGGFDDSVAIAMRDEGRKLKPSEISWYWFERGFAFILSEPWSYLRLLGKKLLLFLWAPEIPNNLSLYYFSSLSSVLSLPVFPGYSLIAPFGFAAILFFSKLRRRAVLLVIYYFLYSLSIVLFFVCARFRVQVIPVLLIFASLCFVKIYYYSRRAQRTDLKRLILLIILCFAFVNMPWFWYEGHHLDKNPSARLTLANAHVKERNWSEARDLYEQALSIDRDAQKRFLGRRRATALWDLAQVCLRLDDISSALDYLNELEALPFVDETYKRRAAQLKRKLRGSNP